MNSFEESKSLSVDGAEFFDGMMSNDSLINLMELQKTRVLLIEDDRTTRRLVSKVLEPYCNFIEATTGGSGVSKYQNFAPDIVFLDLELPDNNGHHILQWMTDNDPGAYVVMFSGNCDSHNMQKAKKYGAKGFVAKPFNPNLMMYYIQQCPKLH